MARTHSAPAWTDWEQRVSSYVTTDGNKIQQHRRGNLFFGGFPRSVNVIPGAWRTFWSVAGRADHRVKVPSVLGELLPPAVWRRLSSTQPGSPDLPFLSVIEAEKKSWMNVGFWGTMNPHALGRSRWFGGRALMVVFGRFKGHFGRTSRVGWNTWTFAGVGDGCSSTHRGWNGRN